MIAGDPLQGVVTGRYLFGAPMPKRPTHWTFTRTPVSVGARGDPRQVPGGALDVRRLVRRPSCSRAPTMASDDAPLAANGQLPLTLDTDAKAGLPYAYTLEGDVEDVSRQHIANRTSCRRASGAVVHRRQAAAVLHRAEGRRQDRARRRRPRRRAGAGRSDRRHAHAGPVEQRAPRRRQRLLHLGDRAQGSAVGRVARDERRGARAARHSAAGRRLLHPRGARATPTGALHRHARRRSTRSARATPRGSATTTTASISFPRRRPTSRARRRGS